MADTRKFAFEHGVIGAWKGVWDGIESVQGLGEANHLELLGQRICTHMTGGY